MTQTASPQMCLNCGVKPAAAGSGTVPLCPGCKKLAKGEERGVRMAPKKGKREK